MPTPAESRALLFIAGLALLGAGARLTRDPAPVAFAGTADTVGALDRQMGAVDAAARRERQRGKRITSKRTRRGKVADIATTPPGPSAPSKPVRLPVPLVDVDLADSAALEGLPGIGPTLAGRILADRAQHGPFGSTTELQRVRGVGPALAARLAPHVTFSGVPRPRTETPPRRRRASVRAP